MRRAHPLADGHHLLLPQGVGLRRGLPSGVLSSLVGKGIGPTTRQPPIWPPAATAGRWATTMRFFAGPRLLVIDEVGYLPLQSEAAAALFQVIAQRYPKSSIVMTTNLGVSSWGQIFDDPMVAAAMLDLPAASRHGVLWGGHRPRSTSTTWIPARASLHADLPDLAEGFEPGEQGRVALGVGPERLGAEQASDLVQHGGHMGLPVGVDATGDRARSFYDGHAIPSFP
jgi:hypothetical protein